MNAVLYLRVSTGRQAEKDLSLPAQQKTCTTFAHNQDFTIAKIFQDAGESALSADRPAFLEMIDYCLDRDNQIKAVICYDTSRFARNREDALYYKRALRKKGVDVLFATQQISRDIEGQLMEGILEIFDEFQSRMNARHTLKSMLRNAELGFCNGGSAPLGYRFIKVDYDGKKKTKLEPDESTTGIVRDIFDLYLMGAGYRSISVEIREKYGRKLTKTTLESILRNKTYKGWIVFQPKTGGIDADQPGVETPGAHPAIIDEATFDQVQVEMSRRGEAQSGRTHSSNSIFTGILHCAHCGAKLTWESALGRGKKRYTYYSCSGKKKGGSCQGLRLPADKLDPFLMEVIGERIFSPENLRGVFDELAKMQQQQPNRHDEVSKKNRQQLERVNKRIARLVEATAEGVLQLHEVKDKINAMRQEKRRLERLAKATGRRDASAGRTSGGLAGTHQDRSISDEDPCQED